MKPDWRYVVIFAFCLAMTGVGVVLLFRYGETSAGAIWTALFALFSAYYAFLLKLGARWDDARR